MKFLSLYRPKALVLLLVTPVIGGCQHIPKIDVVQLTYEMLRAEDCRRNNLEDFCERTYASEYHDYVRAREDFIRSESATDLSPTQFSADEELNLVKVRDQQQTLPLEPEPQL